MANTLQHAAMRRPPSDDNIIAQTSGSGGAVSSVTIPAFTGGTKWISVACDVPFVVHIGTALISDPTVDDVFPAGVQDFLVDSRQTTVKILASAAYEYLIWDSGQKVDQ